MNSSLCNCKVAIYPSQEKRHFPRNDRRKGISAKKKVKSALSFYRQFTKLKTKCIQICMQCGLWTLAIFCYTLILAYSRLTDVITHKEGARSHEYCRSCATYSAGRLLNSYVLFLY